MKRELTKKERSYLNKFYKILETFPNTLELFIDNGNISIIDPDTKQVLEDYFPHVYADGGDPHRCYDDEGNEYLVEEIQ